MSNSKHCYFCNVYFKRLYNLKLHLINKRCKKIDDIISNYYSLYLFINSLKNEKNSIETDQEILVKKPRGRPKKEQVEIVTKKPRGRPKKEQEEQVVINKSRGRPKKEQKIVVKKPRGRPKKVTEIKKEIIPLLQLTKLYVKDNLENNKKLLDEYDTNKEDTHVINIVTNYLCSLFYNKEYPMYYCISYIKRKPALFNIQVEETVHVVKELKDSCDYLYDIVYKIIKKQLVKSFKLIDLELQEDTLSLLLIHLKKKKDILKKAVKSTLYLILYDKSRKIKN